VEKVAHLYIVYECLSLLVRQIELRSQPERDSMKTSQSVETDNLVFILKFDFLRICFTKSYISLDFFTHGHSYTHYTGLAEYACTQQNLLKPFA
jgi:hypothetical protein